MTPPSGCQRYLLTRGFLVKGLGVMTWHIGELLIQKKFITWDDLKAALAEQEQTRELVGQILIRKGLLTPGILYRALAEQSGMRFVELKRIRVNPAAVELIPRSIAEKYELMPIETRQDVLIIGIADPLNVWPETELKSLTKLKDIRTVLCLPTDIREAIEEYYETGSSRSFEIPLSPKAGSEGRSIQGLHQS